MIRLFEELSLNAWPSLQTVHYDGWVLRFADGYTKRANSVNPLYHSTIDLDKKIHYCERVYEGRRLRVVYKLTEKACPQALDTVLSEKGYRVEEHTSVQVLELNDTPNPSQEGFEISDRPNERWLNAYCSLRDMEAANRLTLENMLERVVPRKAYSLLQLKGEVIACGMGVIESGFLGLFNIVVARNRRNKGYGTHLVLNLLEWGRMNRASGAYLQVVEDNTSAKKTFSKLGFTEAYKYWYRIKESR